MSGFVALGMIVFPAFVVGLMATVLQGIAKRLRDRREYRFLSKKLRGEW